MDYEKLYKDLLIQNQINKEENEAFMAEIEEFQEANDKTIKQLEEINLKLTQQNEESQSIQKKLKEELANYKAKNIDKMKDIEIYDKKVQTLESELAQALEEKKKFQCKVVQLENDNDYYMNKIRENEEAINDEIRLRDLALIDNNALQESYDELQANFKGLQEGLDKMREMYQDSLKRCNELEEAKNPIEIRNKSSEVLSRNTSKEEIKENKDDTLPTSAIQKEDNNQKLDIGRKQSKEQGIIYDSLISKILLRQESANKNFIKSTEKRQSLFELKLPLNSPTNKSRQVSLVNHTFSNRLEIESFTVEISGIKNIDSNAIQIQKSTKKNEEDKIEIEREKEQDRICEEVRSQLKEMLVKIQERKKKIIMKQQYILSKLSKHIE